MKKYYEAPSMREVADECEILAASNVSTDIRWEDDLYEDEL